MLPPSLFRRVFNKMKRPHQNDKWTRPSRQCSRKASICSLETKRKPMFFEVSFLKQDFAEALENQLFFPEAFFWLASHFEISALR